MKAHWLIFAAAGGMLVCGCKEAAESPASLLAPSSEPEVSPPEAWPVPSDPVLTQGRAVWMENCENCHAIGKAGSPRFGDRDAWAPRIAKGETALINSAIHGFEGTSEGGMPPRGGEDDLTDDEVASAAKYMIHFSR